MLTSNLKTSHKTNKFWHINLLLLLVGVVAGPILALLIVEEAYLYAFALLFAVPIAFGLNRYPFIALMVWFIFVPLVPADGSTRYLYWIFHRALIPAAVGINIISRMLRLKKHPPIQLGLPDAAMILYLVYGIFSVFFNEASLVSETRLYIYALYDRIFIAFAAYWLVRFVPPDEKQLRRLTYVMLCLLIFEAIIGLLSWFDPSLGQYWSFGANSSLGYRGVGTFNSPGAYSAALMVCALFVLQYAMTKANVQTRYVLLGAVGLAFICIFFSFSRGSWVAAILVAIVIGYLYPKITRRLAIFGFIIMIVLLGTFLSDELTFAVERLNSAQSAGSRLILGNAGQKMFLEKPLLGWGYGTYDVHDWKFMERVGNFVPRRYEIKQGTSHNTYLTILAETGVIGFSLYIFPFFWWLIASLLIIPKLRQPENNTRFLNKRFFILLWANIGFVVTIGQFVDLRFFWFVIGEQWMCLGFIANMVEHYRKKESRT